MLRNGNISVTFPNPNRDMVSTDVNFSALDDEALISLIVRLNPDALNELYDRYSRLVLNLALKMVGDLGTAEEITLDVFTRIWEKASTYRPGQSKVTSWLAGITRNRSIDVLRQQRSRPQQHNLSWAEASSGNQLIVNGIQERVELSMQRERVRLAVAQLPPNQQEALALAYFKGYSHREIAQVLDQPLGTVKTRIRLAMQKLRGILHDEQISN
jgi:RNA polymerase sigma-70 factor (ECF subfamily)